MSYTLIAKADSAVTAQAGYTMMMMMMMMMK